MIRIVLVDDHIPTRNLIRELLSKRDGWQVVAEASDGQQAVQHAKTHQPHLVLLDLQMPFMDGFEADPYIFPAFPQMLILIMSIHDDHQFAEVSRKLGAKGFISKVHIPYKLIPAIETILRGESHFPRHSAAAVN